MKAFPVEDHVKDLKDLDLEKDSPPIQRSLGLSWNLKDDAFTFCVDAEERPFTRRGVLATCQQRVWPSWAGSTCYHPGKVPSSWFDSRHKRLGCPSTYRQGSWMGGLERLFAGSNTVWNFQSVLKGFSVFGTRDRNSCFFGCFNKGNCGSSLLESDKRRWLMWSGVCLRQG